MTPQLISRFAAIVGKENAVTDKALLAPYLAEPRGLYNGCTPLVLKPGSTAEVASVMKLACETRTLIVPQGGNTGLVGAQQPDRSGRQVILSLSRLDRIRFINPQDKVALVEAGVILKTLQQKAEEAGCLFPLSLASEGTAQLGGNLSSNAGGTAVLNYGNARELCLGLEVVLPDGRVLDDLRRVKKDNSGYDLKNLFIGAEGTLGVITAAAVKLFLLPRGKAVAYAGVSSPAQALRLFMLAQDYAGPLLTGFELIARMGVEFSLAYTGQTREPLPQAYPWYVLMELCSPSSQAEAKDRMEAILSRALEQDMADDAVIAASRAQEMAFWQLREAISPAQSREGGSIKHDISVPVAAIPEFLTAAGYAVQALIPDARIVAFGHMGDGNLHYNISQPAGGRPEMFLARRREINRHIHTLAIHYGGAFSAEHGIGQMKRDELVAFKPPVAVDLMRGIKKLLDPHGIMNPGKIL